MDRGDGAGLPARDAAVTRAILSVKRMDEVLALEDPPQSILDIAKAAQAENHPTA